MKKNVIRLTESELKNYIRKVISEQTAPSPTTPSLDVIKKELEGKTVDLYTDAARTKKQTQFRMDKFELTTVNGLPRLTIHGTDYNHFNEYGQKTNSPKAMRIMNIYVSCNYGNFATTPTDTEGNHSDTFSRTISVFNNSLLEKVKSLLGCEALKRKEAVDFTASAGSNKPANFA